MYDRDDESVIAKHLVGGTPLGPVVDILLGGGMEFFLPNTTKGSSRPDDTDVFALAAKNGYYTFTNRTEFDNLQGGNAKHATKPYLGLFTADHMSYEAGCVPIHWHVPSDLHFLIAGQGQFQGTKSAGDDQDCDQIIGACYSKLEQWVLLGKGAFFLCNFHPAYVTLDG